MRQPNTPHRRRVKKSPLDPILNELKGCAELGLHREALRVARRILNQSTITVARFEAAMGAVLVVGNRLSRWRKTVGEGYARLSPSEQRRVRFWMLSFYHAAEDYRSAGQFIPEKFRGPFDLVELAFAWDIWLALKDEQSLARSFDMVVEEAAQAGHPETRGHLYACLGDYCIHRAWWRRAADYYKEIPDESAHAPKAVLGPLLALAGEFLTECPNRRDALAAIQRNHNPDVSSGLAMELSATNRKLGRELRALESGMRRLLGQKRLKSLEL